MKDVIILGCCFGGVMFGVVVGILGRVGSDFVGCVVLNSLLIW